MSLVGTLALGAGTSVATNVAGQAQGMVSGAVGNLTSGVTGFISNFVGNLLGGDAGTDGNSFVAEPAVIELCYQMKSSGASMTSFFTEANKILKNKSGYSNSKWHDYFKTALKKMWNEMDVNAFKASMSTPKTTTSTPKTTTAVKTKATTDSLSKLEATLSTSTKPQVKQASFNPILIVVMILIFFGMKK